MKGIVRVGPWGSIGTPFASRDTLGTYPVNCARSGWPDQPWAAYWIRSQQLPLSAGIPTSGVMGLGSTVTVTRASAFITINFCYQATEPTYIYVNGSFGTASRGATTVLEWSVQTTEGDTISGGDSPSLGSSFGSSYNLPATVFGRFRFHVSATTPTQAETGFPRQEVDLSVTLS
jgi:hypothetical protein